VVVGAGLDGDDTVSIGDDDLTDLTATSGMISVQVPKDLAPGPYGVTVTAPDGTAGMLHHGLTLVPQLDATAKALHISIRRGATLVVLYWVETSCTGARGSSRRRSRRSARCTGQQSADRGSVQQAPTQYKRWSYWPRACRGARWRRRCEAQEGNYCLMPC
jgi:hypothetical protein